MEIEAAYSRLGQTLGWRFLTGPRSAFVADPKVALMTLQPAGRRDYPERPRRSSEAGSAYIIESWNDHPAGADPLQRQIRMLFNELAARMGEQSGDELLNDSLTAHFVPFRSPSLAELHNRKASLEFANSLWRKIFELIRPQVLVVLDEQSFKAASRLIGSNLSQSPSINSISIGWGNYVARIQDFANGPILCWFPHLSRFQIFGRAKSQRNVEEIVTALSRRRLCSVSGND